MATREHKTQPAADARGFARTIQRLQLVFFVAVISTMTVAAGGRAAGGGSSLSLTAVLALALLRVFAALGAMRRLVGRVQSFTCDDERTVRVGEV